MRFANGLRFRRPRTEFENGRGPAPHPISHPPYQPPPPKPPNQREARHLIEALRLGIAPAEHVSDLTVSLEAEKASLVQALHDSHQQGGAVRAVVGEYGFGKSHMVELATQEALTRNFLVATISLDLQELPPHRPFAIYQEAMRHLRYPDTDEQGLRLLLEKTAALPHAVTHFHQNAPTPNDPLAVALDRMASITSSRQRGAWAAWLMGGKRTPNMDLGELAGALTERGARKTLLFCNSRHEVEKTAAYLRQKLSHHAEIFVHYSTLDSQVRLAVAQGSWPLSVAAAANDPPLELEETAVYGFRPSVLVQQIFSLIRQSPTGQVRLADVRRLAPPHLTSEAVRSIVSELVWAEYLQAGRLGDWGAGPALQELLDRHEIYSNIGTEVQMATAVDAYSGQVLGQTERSYPTGAILLWGGRPMRVVWQDKYRFGLTSAPHLVIDDGVRFGGGEIAIPFVVAQAVARGLGIAPAEMPFLPTGEGIWLFHFWETVWGKLLAELLLAQGVMATSADEYALYLPLAIPALPPWDETLARRVGQRTAANLADMLGMGRFHSLLPADLAHAAVVSLLNLARLGRLYRATTLSHRPELGESLTALHEG